MDLLNWLLTVAWKVYAWFGDGFAVLYSNAANALNYAVTQATTAYNNAVNYAVSLRNGLLVNIANVISLISTRITEIKTTINGWTDWLEHVIGDVYDNLPGMIQDALPDIGEAISNALEGVLDPVYDWVMDRINEAKTAINTPLAWLFNLKTGIQQAVTTIQAITPAKMLLFFNTQLTTITEFYNDPIGFIYNIIWPTFINFLCFLIAYGIGTTNSELPPKPTFKK